MRYRRATQLRLLLLVGVLLSATTASTVAQTPAPAVGSTDSAGAQAPGRSAGAAADRRSGASGSEASRQLPEDASTRHRVDLADRALSFTATAGSIRLSGPAGEPQADVAYIDYRLDAEEGRTRPVTFVLNGGPGASSAWLHLGSLGPWRIQLAGDGASPSAVPDLIANAETWLDFTDLVFLDPVGTGYSAFVRPADDVRRRFWSVDGDIQSLAEVIRRWLEKNGRVASPKFLVGESYGGFRGPRLARALQSEQGIGIGGLVLVSPILDFGNRGGPFAPLSWVARLPSMIAAARASMGRLSPGDLAEAERYAAGDYLVDLLRGERDAVAATRVSERVAALTGLDPELVRRRHGRLEMGEFLREVRRDAGRVASAYDATVTAPDPFPASPSSQYPDPVLDALIAPLTSAMLDLYGRHLGWRPEARRYELLNRSVNREWDWGRSLSAPEAVTGLRTALAFDERLRVLVAHGQFDLVTPYFASKLILDQIPLGAGGDRVRFVTYPGGHMFYAVDGSRAALRAEARTVIEGR